jgi:hypothetical protein
MRKYAVRTSQRTRLACIRKITWWCIGKVSLIKTALFWAVTLRVVEFLNDERNFPGSKSNLWDSGPPEEGTDSFPRNADKKLKLLAA